MIVKMMHFKNLPLARFCVAQMRTMSDKIKKSGQLSEKRLFKKNWTKKKSCDASFFSFSLNPSKESSFIFSGKKAVALLSAQEGAYYENASCEASRQYIFISHNTPPPLFLSLSMQRHYEGPGVSIFSYAFSIR